MHCTSFPASFLFSRLSGSAATVTTLFFYIIIFSHPSQVSPVFRVAYITFLGFLDLLCFPSALPDPVPRIPSLSSCPPYDATFSLGRRVLRLWLLVTRWRHPPSSVFRPTSITISKVPRLSLPSSLLSILVPVYAPVLTPIPVLVPIPVLHIISVSSPVPVPVPVGSLPSLVPWPPLGTTSSGRHRIVRPKLLATFWCHLLSIETMQRAEPLLPTSPLYSRPLSLLRSTRVPIFATAATPVPVSVPVSATALVSVPAPVSVLCVRMCVRISRTVL